MAESSGRAKVVSIARGFAKRDTQAKRYRIQAAYPDAVRELLGSLHPRVNALLIERGGKWEFFERLRDEPGAASVLAHITLRELIGMLEGACERGEEGERLTLSPWPGFDLAILLRNGKPRYAVAFEPETSIYVAEETMPKVARFFDESGASASAPAGG